MVAFVIEKGYIPPGDVLGNVPLDCISLARFPGNPATKTYDTTLPDFHSLMAFGLGTVTGPSTELGDEKIGFPVTMSEFVRGSSKQTTVMCVSSLFLFISFR